MKKPTILTILLLVSGTFIFSQKVLTVGKYSITVPNEPIGVKKYESGTIVEYYVEIKNDTVFHYEFWGSTQYNKYRSAEIHMCPLAVIEKDEFDIEQVIGEDYSYFRASIWTSSLGKPSLKVLTYEYEEDGKKVKKSRDMYISLYADSKEALTNIKSKLR
jgi:hypothetical protein